MILQELFLPCVDPAKYDFAETRAIAVYDDASSVEATTDDRTNTGSPVEGVLEKIGKEPIVSARVLAVSSGGGNAVNHDDLKAVFKRAAWYSLLLTAIVAVLGEPSS